MRFFFIYFNFLFRLKQSARKTKKYTGGVPMSYYANGSGEITFREELTDLAIKRIEQLLKDEFFEFDFFVSPQHVLSKNPHNPIGVIFWQDAKYHGECVGNMLNQITNEFPATKGEIRYVGEDDSHWRFLFRKEQALWFEQNGHVVYEE